MKVYFILLMFLASPIYSSTKPITISKVSDGDTVILSDDRRVRLIGVDTTEKSDPRKPLQYFSAEATEFLRKLIEGKEVEGIFEGYISEYLRVKLKGYNGIEGDILSLTISGTDKDNPCLLVNR